MLATYTHTAAQNKIHPIQTQIYQKIVKHVLSSGGFTQQCFAFRAYTTSDLFLRRRFCSNPMAAQSAQYDARKKTQAILMAKKLKNSAADRRLNVNESTVCRWRRQLDVLFMYEPDRKGFRAPRRGHHLDLEKKVQSWSLTKVGPWHPLEESSDHAHGKSLNGCPQSGTASRMTRLFVCLRSVWYRMTSTVREWHHLGRRPWSTPPPTTTTMSDKKIICPKLASVHHHLFKIKVPFYSSVGVALQWWLYSFFMGHNEKTPLALESGRATIE